jgi:hypothetical protein
MRVLVICLLLCVGVGDVALAPTSEQLLKLYGAPTKGLLNKDGYPDSQSFTVPPKINLSVLYGPDHYACRITFEPAESRSWKGRQNYHHVAPPRK